MQPWYSVLAGQKQMKTGLLLAEEIENTVKSCDGFEIKVS
jgi:hypothetical protein